MRALLVRGMLVGLAAGVLAFVFAKIFGEPAIDKAIAFEHARNAAAGVAEEAPLVSRGMQSTLGLLTATVIFGVAMGGIFALVFAAAQGRIAATRPRVTAAILALVGFVVIILVPFTKYPSNPPAVGSDETIAYRTQLYAAMIAISVAGSVAALRLGRDFVRRFGAWNGVLAGVASFVVIVAVGELLMPSLDEIPRGFSPSVIWHFRVATIGTHLVLWTTLGLGFGALAERLPAPRRAGAPARAHKALT
jgi:pimeloyl-ACP methyl ester carboxylesterase